MLDKAGVFNFSILADVLLLLHWLYTSKYADNDTGYPKIDLYSVLSLFPQPLGFLRPKFLQQYRQQ